MSTMINIESLCLSCMTDIGFGLSCPNCGERLQSQKNATALPLKTILNKRFVIGCVLGNPGGFGITYLVWDMLLDTTAAIKEFLPLSAVSRGSDNTTVRANSKQDQAFFKQGLQIFLKEAKTLAQFSHPNIVRIRDCFTSNNTAYLVMEYHHGQPLDQVVAQAGGQLSEDKALELILPILDGLEAVHNKRFLHRDIKPQNIYITDKGIPLLLDFGASRFALTDDTQALTVMLSAGYAPFEQYHEKGKQGIWSDIYSIGATLYFMTTGKMPCNALERQHNDKITAPIILNPQLSNSFSLAIIKAMAVNPQLRPKTIGALKQSLITGTQHFLPVSPTSLPPKEKLPLPSKNKKRPSTIIYNDKIPSNLSWGRILLYIGIVTIVWSGWNSRQKQETDHSIPLSGIENNLQIEIGSIDEDATEHSDLIVFPTLAFEQENINEPIIFEQDQQRSKPVKTKPAEAIRYQSAPPERNRNVLSECAYKRQHSHCTLPQSKQTGICLPGHQGQLACFPKPPPPHLKPRFRR